MEEETIPPRPIAHWTHTLALCVVLVLTTTYGHAPNTASALESNSHLTRYSSSLMLEWLLLGSVVAGIYLRRDFFLRAFHHPERLNAHSFGIGIVTYLAGTIAVIAVSGALYFTPLGHQRNTDVVLAMLPHSPLEFFLWFCVSLTAGICDLSRLSAAAAHRLDQTPHVAVLLTALLFGSVHLYEGLGAILPLAALGFVYGLVVYYFKGDLRAVIVAHTLQDFLVALFASAALHLKQFVPH
jgi:hypothetical protein